MAESDPRPPVRCGPFSFPGVYCLVEDLGGPFVSYRIAAWILIPLTIFFVCLGVACLVPREPFVHVNAGASHYRISLYWIAGWSFYVGFLCFCGFRYCRIRAASREAGPRDLLLLAAGKGFLVLGVIVLLFFFLTPEIVR